MIFILSFGLMFSNLVAADCSSIGPDFQRLSEVVNANNKRQSDNLDYVGNYLLNLHSSLKNWEGRKVAVPRGQFNFLKEDGDLIKDVAQSSYTTGKDIAKSLQALQQRLSECIK